MPGEKRKRYTLNQGWFLYNEFTGERVRLERSFRARSCPTSFSTSPLRYPIIVLNLRRPRQHCWFPPSNPWASLSQIFQILVNIPSASALTQRSHSFSLSPSISPFTHQQVPLVLSLKHILNLAFSIFSITTTRFQATVTSYLPPCFNFCSPTAAYLSQIISPCLKPSSVFSFLYRQEDCPTGSWSGSSLSLPSLISCFSSLAHPSPRHYWLSFPSLTSPSMNLAQHLCICFPLCLKHCSLSLKCSSVFRPLPVHLLMAYVLAQMLPLQKGLPRSFWLK